MPSQRRSSSASSNHAPVEDKDSVNAQQSEEEKPRLTETQRKANHIASEQKRRKAIRDAYELLTEIVPGTAGMSRSEGMVLRATLDHIKSELERRKSLVEKLEERGERVGDEDKTVLRQLEHASERTNQKWAETQQRNT